MASEQWDQHRPWVNAWGGQPGSPGTVASGGMADWITKLSGLSAGTAPSAAPSATPSLLDLLKGSQATSLGTIRGYGSSALSELQGFSKPDVPQAQTSFNIRGAPANLPTATASFTAPTLTNNIPGTVGDAETRLAELMNANPTAEAQQRLAAVFGGLGQFQGGVSSQDMAALEAQQKQALAHAAGQIGERLFAGRATAGGATNLASVAAAESAADFSRQYADAQRFGRQQQLEALGLSGQLGIQGGQLSLQQSQQQAQAAQTLGQFGLERGSQDLQRQISQGQLSAEAGKQALEAQGINIDAALKAAQLAQSGDIAAADLALRGTGMNIDSAIRVSEIDLRAREDKANQFWQSGLAEAGIQGQTPEAQFLQSLLGFYGTTAPQTTSTGTTGTPGMLNINLGLTGRSSGA